MAFMLSPGVDVNEIDLTTIVPSTATSIAAFAGIFNWGPIDQITSIPDQNKLLSVFGKPDSTNYEYWFSAANFLDYSNSLRVVRAANTTGTKTATSNGASLLIKNDTDWEINYSSGTYTYGEFAARFAGSKGNSLKVSMADAGSFAAWAYKLEFGNTAPGTSQWSADAGATGDELHIIVIDEDGKFTGVANTVLEKFAFVSKASDAKTDSGDSNYYKNVISRQSKYIHWMAHPPEGSNWGSSATDVVSFDPLSVAVTKSLTAGADGTVSAGDIMLAYDLFDNADAVNVSLIISGPATTAIATDLIAMCESRKDAIVCISPEKADVVDNYGSEVTDVVAFRNTLTTSSYAFMDCNWKYQYDRYNDVYRWIPLNGDIAGLIARADEDRDPWYSPGGFNRGIIKNVIKLAWNPTKMDRDDLYVNGVNPVVTFMGEGTVLYGDKTLLAKPSAFDRINVRRLFIVLEKSIAKAARYTLFEFNDQFTRAQFVSMVEPYLRDVQGRRGVTDFRVVCDSTNNTPEVIDRNEFVGDIYIKPARSINFIKLNFIATRTGVSFDEVVGKF